ncbi:uncharacterized protein LOC127804310 [Diospyros lotus]|uniref:uncharacterized protein LOC127804310 n=1 Tax=Diospyros lotus TaxID=55363 RepID=UPI002257056F|nr:uncharacterized protein LOC127804310 [Diospyros lotus]
MSSRRLKSPVARPIRRRESCRRRILRTHKSPRTAGCGGVECSSVSDKLEALKSLIPAQHGGDIKAEQLFQQTADYIVLLKTQVLILQKLVDFYGQNHNAV